jgi:putative ABC transport system permease protein
MRTPLAWLNLRHDKTRTATALAGTAFAVVLILMQLGFFKSILHTATVVYDQLEFDVALSSVKYRQMLKAGYFDRDRLEIARALPEVADAYPLDCALQLYRNPETQLKRAILILGVDPRRHYLKAVTREQVDQLFPRGRVLLDELSRPEYGPRYAGLQSEIGDKRIEVTSLFTLGTGFGADGTVVTNEETFADIFAPRTINQISLGLLKLKPGSDPDVAVAKLRRLLPADVAVHTRAAFIAQEQYYWVVKTNVGVIFGLGVLVAFLVGTAIVYQVLSADIARRMPEYATLKAMGYPGSYLTGVILKQASIIGVLGFVPGWLLADALYAVTRRQAHLWMEMGVALPIIVLVLSILMCCLSGLASLRKVHSAAPAELFT